MQYCIRLLCTVFGHLLTQSLKINGIPREPAEAKQCLTVQREHCVGINHGGKPMSAVLEGRLSKFESRVADLKDFCLRAKQANLEDDSVFKTLLFEAQGMLELSDAAIAEALRVSRPTVSRWIRGKNLPHRALRPSVIRWIEEVASQKITLLRNQLGVRLATL
jgi:hypothetical protein